MAALAVYLAHAPLDWDWEMPSVTMIAIVLAGGLIAAAETQASTVTVIGNESTSGSDVGSSTISPSSPGGSSNPRLQE
jgi:hypothetical protein